MKRDVRDTGELINLNKKNTRAGGNTKGGNNNILER